MATSLSRQLANLAVRPVGSVVAERPSLLFPVFIVHIEKIKK